MNVLILGGTVFLGRHLVAELLARGHRVTTFNRGTHDVDAALPITTIRGDRTVAADLARIPTDGWDAVIDPSSDVPHVVEAAARQLRSAGRYVYISSVSAYDLGQTQIDEQARLFTRHDGDPDADEAYGWRKATSEARAAAIFGARTTLIRPGLIVGPFDPTDRFTYWPQRLARGGDVLVPGPPDRAIQFIDVRDVAAFIVRTIEADLGGAYNVTSPPGAISMRDLIDACRDDVSALPIVHWVDAEFVVEHGCTGWIDLPLWVPPDSPYARALFAADTGRATAAGLRLRPLADTVRATREWCARSERTVLATGLDPAREKELLDEWNAVISS
jgi:2'-hydroxyisoflavone reductase